MDFTVAVTVPVFFESGEEPANRLREAGLRFGQMADGPGSPARLVELLDGADAVIASSTDPYIEEVLAALPRLKHVARWGVGYEAVDLAACTRHGVIATRVVGALTEAVADHAFALLLGLARRLAEGDHLIRSDGWQQLQGRSVAGKTLGLIGFGPIGQAVADRARGFRMRILVHDPYQSDEVLALHGAERAEFAALLAASDYVSLHAASTPETRHLLNATTLALLKPNAVLINTARGALVDEAALSEALRADRLGGAALDTYAVEPLPADSPLRTAPRTLLMPHCASNTLESAAAVSHQVCDAILAVAAGRVPLNVLNPEVLTAPNLRAKMDNAPR